MDKIDSFNASDNLKQMYVFSVRFSRPSSGRYSCKYRIESSPFNYKESCAGAMHQEINELKAKGMNILSYYIEAVMASDTTKQF